MLMLMREEKDITWSGLTSYMPVEYSLGQLHFSLMSMDQWLLLRAMADSIMMIQFSRHYWRISQNATGAYTDQPHILYIT